MFRLCVPGYMYVWLLCTCTGAFSLVSLCVHSCAGLSLFHIRACGPVCVRVCDYACVIVVVHVCFQLVYVSVHLCELACG